MILVWSGLPLPVTRLIEFVGEAVYDPSGTDYVASKYTVAVEIMLSRVGDGYRVALNTDEGPVPQYVNGLLARTQTATLSIAAIRHALSQRSSFCLFEQNPVTRLPDVLLASDAPDVLSGPVPQNPVILESMHGQGNTAFIQFVFSCHIRECSLLTTGISSVYREIRRSSPDAKNTLSSTSSRRSSSDPKGGKVGGDATVHDQRQHAFDGTPLAAPRGRLLLASINGRTPILLSNRWTTTTAILPENETTVAITRGLALFNRQGLALLDAASVEQFTRSLVPPLVPNCLREVRELTVSPDGLALQWEIGDVEVTRGYLDFPCTSANGRVRLVNPNGAPRYVAGVSLVSRRQFDQPAVARGLNEFWSFLSTANFANESTNADASPVDAAKMVPGVGEGAAAVAKSGQAELRRWVNRAIAGAQTLDSVLPTVTESAAAEVRGTRESRLQHLQSLALALCSGALGIGNSAESSAVRTGQIAKWALLPPATQLTLEIDHLAPSVRCVLTIVRGGLADFCLGETQAATNRLLLPVSDDVTGGRCPLSVFNVLDALGLLPSLGALGGLTATPVGVTKLVDGTIVNAYADQLLITASDCILRGPSGDGLSRSLSANLVRAAAALLRPCETPSGPVNQFIALPHTEVVVEKQGTGANVGVDKPQPDPKAILDAFVPVWNANAKPPFGPK